MIVVPPAGRQPDRMELVSPGHAQPGMAQPSPDLIASRATALIDLVERSLEVEGDAGSLRAESLSSFRGFYTILFREHSGLVHATMRGLNHVTIDLASPCKRVVLEASLGESSPYGMATVVYGVGLLVAAKALGWPDADEVALVVNP